MCKGKADFSVHASTTDCRKFHWCIKQVTYENACAANQYFDDKLFICREGQCKPTSDNEVSISETSNVCQPSSKLHRVADNCYAYEQCIAGYKMQFICPKGEYFKSTTKTCEPIEHDVNHLCGCVMPERTVLNNPNDCQSYYRCLNGQALLRQCQPGHYFDRQKSSCLPDFKHFCIGNVVEKPVIEELPEQLPEQLPEELPEELPEQLPEKLPEELPEELPAQPAATSAQKHCLAAEKEKPMFLANEQYCNQFYLCLNGQLFEKQCPVDFYFDAKERYCRFDVKKQCPNRLQTKPIRRPWQQHAAPHHLQEQEQTEKLEQTTTQKKQNEKFLQNKPKVTQTQNKQNVELETKKEQQSLQPQREQQQPAMPPAGNSLYDKLASKFMSFF